MSDYHPLDSFKAEFSSAVSREVDAMIHEIGLARAREIERLTREQFKEALIQAIDSGDFLARVYVDRHENTELRCVTYEPGRRVRELQGRIAEQAKRIQELEIALAVERQEVTPSDTSSIGE